MIKLKYNGHANISLTKDNVTILIDPFFTDNPVNKTNPNEVECDYILVSHAHFDHIGDAIDIAKFIMAIMVVIIHRPLFNDNMVFTNFIIGQVICSIAVPFFFIVSSYFLFSKLNKSTEFSKTIVFEYEKRISCVIPIFIR